MGVQRIVGAHSRTLFGAWRFGSVSVCFSVPVSGSDPDDSFLFGGTQCSVNQADSDPSRTGFDLGRALFPAVFSEHSYPVAGPYPVHLIGRARVSRAGRLSPLLGLQGLPLQVRGSRKSLDLFSPSVAYAFEPQGGSQRFNGGAASAECRVVGVALLDLGQPSCAGCVCACSLGDRQSGVVDPSHQFLANCGVLTCRG